MFAKNKHTSIGIIFFLLDVIALILSSKYIFWNQNIDFKIDIFLVYIISWILVYKFFGFYHQVLQKSRSRELNLNLILSIFLCLVNAFLLINFSNINPSINNFIKLYISIFLSHFIITSFFKTISLQYVKNLIKNEKVLFNTLIIGDVNQKNDILKERKTIEKLLGFNFVGYISNSYNETNQFQELKYLGNIDQLESIMINYQIEQVIINHDTKTITNPRSLVNRLKNYDAKISVVPDMYETLIGAVSLRHVFSVPLIEIKQDPLQYWQQNIKDSLDFNISLLVLILGFPFLLLISIITKLTSKGSVFYTQERIGLNGKKFQIYKFRSMIVNAEIDKPLLSNSQDPRITKWGRFMRKTGIDELPQFYNVLKNEMSVVGPRPEREYFLNQLELLIPNVSDRLRIKPGITSLAQVKYGYADTVIKMTERLSYDIFYIDNMSLSLDLKIIFFTIIAIIKGRQ